MAKSGRRSWPVERRREFATRLYGIMTERFGSEAPFEQFKRRLVPFRVKTRESTVRGWLPPLERLAAGTVRLRDWESLRAPDIVSLAEIARMLDVSTDYLLGEDVPRRVSDRRPLGHPGPAILAHVVRDYDKRVQHANRDGLAFAVGARWVRVQLQPEVGVDSRARAAIDLEPGAFLPNGCIVAQQSDEEVAVMDADSHDFVQRICDHVFEVAERWESENNAVVERQEREQLLTWIREIDAGLPRIAVVTHPEEDPATAIASLRSQLLGILLEPDSDQSFATLLKLQRVLVLLPAAE